MKINELLDVIEYGLTYYRSESSNQAMNLIEYFSFTDITPLELSKLAFKQENRKMGLYLLDFSERNYWLLKPLDLSKKLNLYHSIKDYVLTPEDKINIKEKLEQEGYPLLEGVFDQAARSYVTEGIDSISREKIRDSIIEKEEFKKYVKVKSI